MLQNHIKQLNNKYQLKMFITYLRTIAVNIASTCDILLSIVYLSTLSFSFSADGPAIILFNFSSSPSFPSTSSLIIKFTFSIYETTNKENPKVRIKEN
uniref:Uncharacterized protein n=1 Tax=Helianthus annuus TaxID=4232 RepID=A0A251VH70_HELAN